MESRLTNIIDMIEGYFDYSSGEHGPKNAHWPSEVTSCVRQLYWKWKRAAESNPIQPGDWWRMKIGNAIHALIQLSMLDIASDVKKMAALAWPDFKVDSEVRSGDVSVPGLEQPIRFRTDLEFVDKDGQKAVIEIKSTYGRGVLDIKENGPKDSTIMQGILYLVLGGAARVYFPRISRDSADRVQFVMEKAEGGFTLSRMFPGGGEGVYKRIPAGQFDKAIDRFQEVEQAVKNDQLPYRPYIVAIKNGEIKTAGFQKNNVKYKGDWQCTYCAFMDKCWSPVLRDYANSDNSAAIEAHKAKNGESEDE